MNREFHVSVNGCDHAEGTKENPFRTISKAAAAAETGDKVIVHEGEYREWVKPAHTGYSDISRITYEAAEGERLSLKARKESKTGRIRKGPYGRPLCPIPCSGITIPIQRC